MAYSVPASGKCSVLPWLGLKGVLVCLTSAPREAADTCCMHPHMNYAQCMTAVHQRPLWLTLRCAHAIDLHCCTVIGAIPVMAQAPHYLKFQEWAVGAGSHAGAGPGWERHAHHGMAGALHV